MSGGRAGATVGSLDPNGRFADRLDLILTRLQALFRSPGLTV